MASMLGRGRSAHWHIGCDCISKKSLRAAERRQWKRDYREEKAGQEGARHG